MSADLFEGHGDDELADQIIALVHEQSDCFGCTISAMTEAIGYVIAQQSLSEEATADQMEEFRTEVSRNIRAVAIRHYVMDGCHNQIPA